MHASMRVLFAFTAVSALTLSFCSVSSPARASADGAGIRQRFDRFAVADPAARLDGVRVAGDFAVADVRVRQEDRPYRGQLLLRRYAFGWQIVAYGAPHLDACRLRAFDVPPRATRELLAADPTVAPPAACGSRATHPSDASPADESAVQHLLAVRFPQQASNVWIDGDYAFGSFGFNGGGTAVFAKSHGTWRMLAGGGGFLGACGMVSAGVPRAVAHDMMQRSFPNGTAWASSDVARCR